MRVAKGTHLRGDTPLDFTIGLPEGSSVMPQTASADVSCSGELGALDGHTASGDVTADRVTGAVDLATASGDVRLTDVAGDVSVSTASGDSTIMRIGGGLIAKTASGDLRIGQAGRSAEVKTASGDVRSTASPRAGPMSRRCLATSRSRWCQAPVSTSTCPRSAVMSGASSTPIPATAAPARPT